MDGRDKAAAFGLGALGGAVAGFLLWQGLRGIVAAQVHATIDEAVPPLVRTEIDHKFATLGITPALATNVRVLMENLDRLHLFEALAAGTTPR